MSISNKKRMVTNVLLACGIICSLLTIGTDIIAAMSWDGYSYIDQSASEISAIGAPTRSFVVPLLSASTVLVLAFGIGILRTVHGKRALRISGILLVIFGAIGVMNLFFPMNLRGDEQAFTGTMHIIFTGVNILLMLLFIGFGAASRGKGFRIYSIGTILAILIFGALVGVQAPQVDAGLPTPWLGVIERVSYYSPYLWMLVLSIVVLRSRRNMPQRYFRNRKHHEFTTARINW
jgi:hypothetical protein